MITASATTTTVATRCQVTAGFGPAVTAGVAPAVLVVTGSPYPAVRGYAHPPGGACPGSRLFPVADLLVWIDCEMTGLDLGKDKLIEVAALVTDPELNVLGEGVDLVIHAQQALLACPAQLAREHPHQSRLTDAARA